MRYSGSNRNKISDGTVSCDNIPKSWPLLVFAQYRVFGVGSKSRESKLNKNKANKVEYEKNNNNKKTAAFKLMEGSPTQQKLH